MDQKKIKKSSDQEPNQKKPNQQQIKSYVEYSGLAFQMIASILLGLWIGQKIDKWINTTIPVFTIAGILLAIVGSLVTLIKNLPKS